MPLPLALVIAAGIAGATGVGSGIHGAKKMKDANDTLKAAEARHNRNIAKFEQTSDKTNNKMDELGKLELEILSSFEKFSDTIEKIQNRPQFKEYKMEGVKLPEYDKEELKKVSVGAGVLLGGLGGAAVGTAGGFAAAGATTSAVMALGTASTGTAIASLSGAAATNATLAALGGGALSVGGGGIALGTTVLSATTLGVGLLVGGVIFNIVGGSMSNKADEAWNQMKTAENTIVTICIYLDKLKTTANKYIDSLKKVNEKYQESFQTISNVVNVQHKVDWNEFTEEEKTDLQNTVLLVGLLYKMCQVKLVNKAKKDNEINSVNTKVVNETLKETEEVMNNLVVGTVGNSEKIITDSKNETSRECYDGTDICKECADVIGCADYIEIDNYLIFEQDRVLVKVAKESGDKVKLDITKGRYLNFASDVCGWGDWVYFVNSRKQYCICGINVETMETINIEYLGDSLGGHQSRGMQANDKYIVYIAYVDGKKKFICYDLQEKKSTFLRLLYPQSDCEREVENFFMIKEDIFVNAHGIYKYNIKSNEWICIKEDLDFNEGRLLRRKKTKYHEGILYSVADFSHPTDNLYVYYVDLNKSLTLQKVKLPGNRENEYCVGYGKVYYVTVDSESELGYYDIRANKREVLMKNCPLVKNFKDGRKIAFVQPSGQVVGKWFYGGLGREVVDVSSGEIDVRIR